MESKFGDRVVAAWESPARAAGKEEAAGRPGYLRRRRRGRESEEVRKFQVPFFSISLNDCEIEEDFLAMTGWRQPRRPKKRSKFVEKKLEVWFFFSIYCLQFVGDKIFVELIRVMQTLIAGDFSGDVVVRDDSGIV